MCSFSETSVRYDNLPNSVHSQKISLVELKQKEMNRDMPDLSNV